MKQIRKCIKYKQMRKCIIKLTYYQRNYETIEQTPK